MGITFPHTLALASKMQSVSTKMDEKMRATVFSTSGQLDSFGQIIGGPIVGLVAQQVSIPWGLVCTAFLLLPALFLVPVAGKNHNNKHDWKHNVYQFKHLKRPPRVTRFFVLETSNFQFYKLGFYYRLLLYIVIMFISKKTPNKHSHSQSYVLHKKGSHTPI